MQHGRRAPSPSDALQEWLRELSIETSDRPDELAQVDRLLAAPGIDDPELVDLEDLPFVTIDNVDSRDLDQALYIERTPNGFRVDYALADAAWYVRPGTPLFARSLRRGASFYFPDRSIPMLPPALSEGLVSLNPNVARRALVLRMELDGDGRHVETEAIRARIRSRAKLGYTQVSRWIEDGSIDDSLDYSDSLFALRDVGEKRSQLALERGVVPYRRDEATIRFESDELRIDRRHRDASQSWNEQISLLCNTAGAKLLARYDALGEAVQSVYRVHSPPVSRRLAELREVLEAFVDEHQLGPKWAWDGERHSLADYLDQLPTDDEADRLRTAIERQIMWTNRASEYTEEAGPHYALAVDPYVRLSSPMREVVGIFTHKELAEGIGWESAGETTSDEELRREVIDAANRSRQQQKQIDKRVLLLALDHLFADDLDVERTERPRRTGTIVGVRSTRLYLLMDDVPLEVKIYVDDLQTRYGTTYRRGAAALVPDGDAPRFRLGDGLSFVVDRWDRGRNRYVLDVEHIA